MENNYTVYVHNNKVNDKKYVGITSKRPEIRWGHNGKGYETQVFGKAIEKYGWDNFDHEIVATGLTKEEACQMEIDLIRKYDSTNHKFGYNIQPGGELGNAGVEFSEETKKKMSESQKKAWEKVPPEKRFRSSKWMNLPVYCIERDKHYDTIEQAMEDIGVASKQSITRVLNHFDMKCQKCHWVTEEFASQHPDDISLLKENPSFFNAPKGVLMEEIVCVETGEINTVKNFASSLGIKAVYEFRRALNDDNKTVGGFHFKTKIAIGLEKPNQFRPVPGRSNRGIGVQCVETQQEFPSMMSACRYYNLDYTAFRKYLQCVELGQAKEKFGGFHWIPISRGK